MTQAPTHPRGNSADARQRRVAILDHTGTLSGAEIALLRWAPLLADAGAQPVVVLFADGELACALREAQVEVHVLPMAGEVLATDRSAVARFSPATLLALLRTVSFTPRLARKLRALHVEAVVTNSLKSDLIGGVAARLARRPLVWYVHDRISEDYLPARVAQAVRWLARHLPQHVLANSQATLQTLNPAHPAAAEQQRWSVAYPGLPQEYLNPPPRTPSADRPTVGMVGRLSPTKGQEVFLRAAAKVHATHPQVRFQIVGAALFNEQEYASRVHALAAELGLGEVVEFTGQVADVPARLATYSLLVHASPTPEPFGQVIVEAMAAGVPVIATDAGGVAEIFNHQPTGLGRLVPPGDVEALAAAMHAVLADPAQAEEDAARAQARVRELYTARQSATQVARAVEAAISRTTRKASGSNQTHL